MPGLRDPLPGRAMVPRLRTTLPTPGRWWYLPMLRGDDHRRRTHRRHGREPTLARGRRTRPSLKKPPRFEGKLIDVRVRKSLRVQQRHLAECGEVDGDACLLTLASIDHEDGRLSGFAVMGRYSVDRVHRPIEI